MNMKKKALGRGLNALIPESITDTKYDTDKYVLEQIPLELIVPNQDQPRKRFDDEEIRSLADNIAIYGVIQPIIVRRLGTGDQYEIIAGERRWRASSMIHLESIPALVLNEEEHRYYQLALIENLQRVDLNPIEEAIAYQTLIDDYNMTQQKVAEVVSKSRAHVTNIIRLLSLTDYVKGKVVDGSLSMGHARCLITLDQFLQDELCNKIILNNLSVREVEKEIKRLGTEELKPKLDEGIKKEKDPFLCDVERKFEDILGTKVQIIEGKKHHKIEIEYYTEEDLERILSIIRK